MANEGVETGGDTAGTLNEALTGTVDATAGAVDNTVGAIDGALGGAVGTTGAAANETVGAMGQSVTQVTPAAATVLNDGATGTAEVVDGGNQTLNAITDGVGGVVSDGVGSAPSAPSGNGPLDVSPVVEATADGTGELVGEVGDATHPAIAGAAETVNSAAETGSATTQNPTEAAGSLVESTRGRRRPASPRGTCRARSTR